jgi:TAZ zinc finger
MKLGVSSGMNLGMNTSMNEGINSNIGGSINSSSYHGSSSLATERVTNRTAPTSSAAPAPMTPQNLNDSEWKARTPNKEQRLLLLNHSGNDASKRNDSERQEVRHKQQRLLLLRHASRCQYKHSECPVTPHCASMKKLLEHIPHCKNQQCAVPHCRSSRYILSHNRRCKDARCPTCGPVKETIRKRHDREGDARLDADPMSNDVMDPSLSPDHRPERKRAKTEHTISAQPMPPQPQSQSSLLPPSQPIQCQTVSSDSITIKPIVSSSSVAKSSVASSVETSSPSAAAVPSTSLLQRVANLATWCTTHIWKND